MSGANSGEEGARHACASCKHQRRKCSEDTCFLYPYFPAEKTEDFNAVHRYFGVSNINKNIKKLAVEDRDRAVESYVWAAKAWDQNPSSGPLGLYTDLRQENQQLKQENQQFKQENQELKNGRLSLKNQLFAATNYGANSSSFGMDSSVGNYNALIGIPVEDVGINYDQVPANYNQGSGLYDDGQGGLNPNFGNVQQRLNPGNIGYDQRPCLANQTGLPHNRVRERDVRYAPYQPHPVRAQRRDTNHGFANQAFNKQFMPVSEIQKSHD